MRPPLHAGDFSRPILRRTNGALVIAHGLGLVRATLVLRLAIGKVPQVMVTATHCRGDGA